MSDRRPRPANNAGEGEETERVFWPPPEGSAYRELEHPADLMVEIHGSSLPELFSNGLFALYDSMVELEHVEPRDTLRLEVAGTWPPEEDRVASALRTLLAEALYHFATDGFVGSGARVSVNAEVIAEIYGERLDRSRHGLRSEIKAVTYHELKAYLDNGGEWAAVVLFDV